MQDLKRLAEYVRRARKSKGLNQQDIRDRGGPSVGWLGALEAGTLTSAPKPGTLKKLAKALGSPVRDLFELADLEPFSIDEKDLYRLNTLEDRQRFINAVRYWDFPPTAQEVDLILSMPDAPPDSSRALNASVFRTPPEQRWDYLVNLIQGSGQGDLPQIKPAVPADAVDLWESFSVMDPEDQDEIRAMIERRAARIRKERGPGPQ